MTAAQTTAPGGTSQRWGEPVKHYRDPFLVACVVIALAVALLILVLA